MADSDRPARPAAGAAPKVGGEAGLWRTVALDDAGLALEVTRETTLRQLAEAMLGSKAAARRVLARGQLQVVSPEAELAPATALAPDATLAPGTVLYLRFCREESQTTQAPSTAPSERTVPAATPLAHQTAEPLVLYQDPVLLAANKPAGLLVHGDGTGVATLTGRIQALLATQGSSAKAQAVQRLDVETTGLVLFSLTEEFQPALDALVAGHAMRKRYLAVVSGRLPARQRDARGWLVLEGPLARDRHDARRMRVGRTGKPSLTRVRELALQKGLTLVEAELGTGRRHQIRVHLAHAGCPIVGDGLYGGRASADGLMLHAWQEELVHPATGERLVLEAPAPERFGRLFGTAAMRSGY